MLNARLGGTNSVFHFANHHQFTFLCSSFQQSSPHFSTQQFGAQLIALAPLQSVFFSRRILLSHPLILLSAIMTVPRSALLLVALVGLAVVCSAQTPAPKTTTAPKTAGAPAAPLTPFDEAIQKLNKSGFTSFVSLVNAYGKMKEVKAALSKPLTMLVPSNAAIGKLQITKYKSTELMVVVGFSAFKKVIPADALKSLPEGSNITTLASTKAGKPMTLQKLANNKKGQVVLQGKKGSTMAITKLNFYVKPGKLVVHTTDAVAFPTTLQGK
ncbi:unnamed protein product [Closterium sp. Yama58-4]|nr:unnamed protein product [Closterium sp. Yama58-4]